MGKLPAPLPPLPLTRSAGLWASIIRSLSYGALQLRSEMEVLPSWGSSPLIVMVSHIEHPRCVFWALIIDCYWVGSLDLNFWGNQRLFH